VEREVDERGDGEVVVLQALLNHLQGGRRVIGSKSDLPENEHERQGLNIYDGWNE
jgi:hypothetical protein